MKQQTPNHQPRLLRKAVFYGLTFLLVYGVLEFASWVTYTFIADAPFSFAALQTRRTRLINTSNDSTRLNHAVQGVIHPYIGSVGDPSSENKNEYGFFGPSLPIDHTGGSTDTVFVAVLGGSVATFMVAEARETLRQELQRVKRFAGKEIFIANLAMGGKKQPQQLMIVNYFMSLGAPFDLVINLDGFNEIVLPVVEHAKLGTFPFYPRKWKMRVAGLADQDLLRKAGRIAYLGSARHHLAVLASRAPVKYSVTANVFWDQLDLGLLRRIENERVALTQEILDREDPAKPGGTYAENGPTRTYASDEARYRDLATFWKRSSMILNNLAQGSGFEYFHFLQPNQYVRGSKIFSEEERTIALKKRHPYRKAATEGYPYLIAAGKDIAGAGVNYTDLTMLFAGNDEVLYIDGCCHFNRRGYELIAREIARVIRVHLDREGR